MHEPDSPTLLGLSRVDLPAVEYDEDGQAYVVPVGVLAFDAGADRPWLTGNSIGWLIGNGDSLWYHDTSTTSLVGKGIQAFAVAPPPYGALGVGHRKAPCHAPSSSPRYSRESAARITRAVKVAGAHSSVCRRWRPAGRQMSHSWRY